MSTESSTGTPLLHGRLEVPQMSWTNLPFVLHEELLNFGPSPEEPAAEASDPPPDSARPWT